MDALTQPGDRPELVAWRKRRVFESAARKPRNRKRVQRKSKHRTDYRKDYQ